LLLQDLRVLTRTFSETNFGRQPPYVLILSIARLQSYPSGSKKRNFGFLEFLPPTHMIIDTGHPCTEKTILETRCSQIYTSSVFYLLTWTEFDIIAPESLLNGLKVRITADRKDRYTLLLGFPFLHQFEAENGCIHGWIICFVSVHNRFAPICLRSGLKVPITANRKGRYTLLLAFPYFIKLKQLVDLWKDCFASQLYTFVSLHMLTLTIFERGNVSKIGSSSSHFRKVQPAYT